MLQATVYFKYIMTCQYLVLIHMILLTWKLNIFIMELFNVNKEVIPSYSVSRDSLENEMFIHFISEYANPFSTYIF